MSDDDAVRLSDWLLKLEQLTQMSNMALADLLESHAWTDMLPFSFKCAIVSEVIERMRE